ncbi:FAS1 domain-containing protein [Dioscorea alata]|uniref:FAS1 domain-containing protein n=1 Tax=Dioscorea alata TaxID=55571 RepID=A0ACB7VKU3_DIOAL|nr:FAS1 domain-containing protein [Dioscorea alata]
MNSKHTSLLLLLLTTIATTTTTAFNITRLLSNYPDFASFNDLLTQTGLADEINSRQTITILAVDNSGLDAVSDRPVDVVKRILSVHVILDYFDSAKLQKLSKKKNTQLTTLFQTSGIATNQVGFLTVTQMDDGEVSFGSSVPGAGIGANLVKEVVTKPYNISVLQITDIVVPPGIDNLKFQAPPQATPPPPAPKNSGAPASAPSDDEATAPASSSADAETPAVSEAPAAETPVAEAPVAEGPAAASPVADAPKGEKAAAPAADEKSSAGRLGATVAGVAFAVASSFFAAL